MNPPEAGAGPAVSQFVLKAHSRCDLACDHCYVYEHADQSWRRMPRAIAHPTVTQAARRIAEHAVRHALREICVVVHGGEPLLLGPDAMERLLDTLSTEIGAVTSLDLRLHTNGIRLSEAFCELFLRYRVKVGVSLDGDRSANDRHRVFAGGRSSHAGALAAVSLLRKPRYRELFAGILCTIDIRNDPVAVYDALAELEPPRLDFLLPHATWVHPPLRTGVSPTEYADWLGSVHARWQSRGRPVPIRLFEAFDAAAAGRPSGLEGVGTDPVNLLVVDTDGSYMQADSLRTAYDGAPQTGFNVFDHSVDEAAMHPAMKARRTGVAGLSATCRQCEVVHVCGGGLYAHRYSAANAFDNPSVYCADLKALIQTVSVAPVLDGLARIPSDPGSLRSLLHDQQADTVALVAVAARRAGITRPPTAAWQLLTSLDQTSQPAVAKVLGQPYVRAWAARVHADPKSEADLEYVNVLAVSAAVHAGSEATLTFRAHTGTLHFPTLGTLIIPRGPAVTVRVTDGRLIAGLDGRMYPISPDSTHDSPLSWLPLRRLRAAGIDIELDDRDDYRDVYGHPVSRRVNDEEANEWQRRFSDAIRFLDGHLPGYLAEVRSSLVSITPLRSAQGGRHLSGTSRLAPGAIGVALPEDPELLALLIVHELQHRKLWAVLDRFDLVDPRDRALFRVAWREDARPAESVLHGIYAHLAVADFWRAQRDRVDRAPLPRAAAHCERWTNAVDEATGMLLNSGALTEPGAAFLRTLAERRQCENKPQPAAGTNSLHGDTECL